MDFQSKDPDEIIQDIKNKLRFPKGKFPILPFIIGFFIILTILGNVGISLSPIYTIQPEEVGLLLRFGKFVDTTSPGLHFKIPAIDRAIPVPVKSVNKLEFGFKTRSAGVKTVYSQRSYDEVSMMLTGDLNVINVEWIVQYKIQDPYKSLFKVRSINKTIADMSESVMRKIVGDHTLDDVIYSRGELGLGLRAQQELQEILDTYETGVNVVTVKIQGVTVPQAVQPAFSEVEEARQEKEKLINQAWEVYNHKIPQAKGEASKVVREAEGYALDRINSAQGDAQRFLLLYSEYQQAKDITTKRLYLESMNTILEKAGTKYIVDSDEKNILPLLKLNNE